MVVADTAELDKAVEMYYAGSPDKAISLIKPLALSGDVDAQFLLGNILYSLSKTNIFSEKEDPVEWYKMAALQGSADANYALGVIYNNKWIKSNLREDVEMAIFYYDNATKLGNVRAKAVLSKLNYLGETSKKEKPLLGAKSTTGRSKQASKMPNYNSAKQPSVTKLAGNVKQVPGEKSDSESRANNLTDSAKQLYGEIEGTRSATVNLSGLANQCENYTQAGFNYYAASIKGAFFVGDAEIETIGSASSKPGTLLIKLIHKQNDIVILMALKGVPKNIVIGLKVGRELRITGIVEDSQKIGTNCDVILTYKSTN